MAVYTPVLHDDGSIGYRKSGSDSQLSYSRNSNGEGKSRDWYMEAALNYSRKFGDHNVTGLVLYNQSKRYYPEVLMMIFLRLMLALWGVLPMIIKLDIWQSLMLVIMVLRILLQVNVMACSQLALLVGLSVKSLF